MPEYKFYRWFTAFLPVCIYLYQLLNQLLPLPSEFECRLSVEIPSYCIMGYMFLQVDWRRRQITNTEVTTRNAPWINPRSGWKSMTLCPSPAMKQVCTDLNLVQNYDCVWFTSVSLMYSYLEGNNNEYLLHESYT